MLAENEKAIDVLTIDPSQRLQRKVQVLEKEKTLVDAMRFDIEKLKQQIEKFA
jgi:hypothetical protein